MQRGNDDPGSTDRSSGSSTGREHGPSTRRDEAIDLVALRADDDLIDALAAGRVCGPQRFDTADPDAELMAILESWVAEVRPETLVERPAGSVPPETAPRRARRSWSLPSMYRPSMRPPSTYRPSIYGRVAVAAALVVLGSSGIAAGAWQSVPGDSLWAVSKVLYTEHSRSVEAAVDVAGGLRKARAALDAGRPAEAAVAIAAVRDMLELVAPDEGYDMLVQERDLLAAALADPRQTVDATAEPGADAALALGASGAADGTAAPEKTAGSTTSDPPSGTPTVDQETSASPPALAGSTFPYFPSVPADDDPESPESEPATTEPAPPDPGTPEPTSPPTEPAPPSGSPADQTVPYEQSEPPTSTDSAPPEPATPEPPAESTGTSTAGEPAAADPGPAGTDPPPGAPVEDIPVVGDAAAAEQDPPAESSGSAESTSDSTVPAESDPPAVSDGPAGDNSPSSAPSG